MFVNFTPTLLLSLCLLLDAVLMLLTLFDWMPMPPTGSWCGTIKRQSEINHERRHATNGHQTTDRKKKKNNILSNVMRSDERRVERRKFACDNYKSDRNCPEIVKNKFADDVFDPIKLHFRTENNLWIDRNHTRTRTHTRNNHAIKSSFNLVASYVNISSFWQIAQLFSRRRKLQNQ